MWSASQSWHILHHCLTWGALLLCWTTLLRKPLLELEGSVSQALSGPCSCCIPWKYRKLCGKLRCPSFDKSGHYAFEMIGSTKLGEITTRFEGQQLNDVHLFSQLALQPLIMIYMLYIWTLPVLSLTQHSAKDIPVLLLSRSLALYLNTPAWKIPNLGQIKNISIIDIPSLS